MSERKRFTPDQKVSIIRRHLLEHVPVSDLCDEYQIHPNQYYNWQKQFFENGAVAFQRRNKANDQRRQNAQDKKIVQLERKLQQRNEVVAELLEEHVQLKKELGEL